VSAWRDRWDAALGALERESQPDARLAAAQELREMAHESEVAPSELIAALVYVLENGRDWVRRLGVQMIAGLLEPEEAEGLLAGRLSDGSELVRVQAAGLLADFDLPSSREALKPALSDPAFQVRFEAARGLATAGDGAGLDTLIDGLENEHLRFRALGAIVELGDVRALPPVQELFRQPLLPAYEQAQAAGAMAKLGDPEGAAYLIERTQKHWGLDRAFAIELCGEVKAEGAYARLMEIMDDRLDPCRGAAARGLGRLGDVQALQALGAIVENAEEPDELRLDAAEGACLLDPSAGRALVRAASESLSSDEAREEAQKLLEDLK